MMNKGCRGLDTWGLTVVSATHVTLKESDTSESIIWLRFESHDAHFSVHYHTFQRPMAVLGKWVALNYLDTSFVCIMGLVHLGNVVTVLSG